MSKENSLITSVNIIFNSDSKHIFFHRSLMLLTIIAKVVNEDNFMDEFLRTAIQYTGKSKEKTNMQINDLELLKRNIRIGKYKLAKGKTFIFITYSPKYNSLRPSIND